MKKLAIAFAGSLCLLLGGDALAADKPAKQASSCPYPDSYFTPGACQARSKASFPNVDAVSWCAANRNGRSKHPGC